jgi:hypothetical protein
MIGFVMLLASTLPLGPEIWRDYLKTYRSFAGMVATITPMWKQETIYAFWRSLLVTPHSAPALVLWLITILPLLGVTLAAWLRCKLDAERLPRLFGLTALSIVSCNFYVPIYDGILLAMPGTVWYMQRNSYRSGSCHWIGGAALSFIYVWQHLTTWVLDGGWALVGPAVAVWLGADAWDLIGPRRSPTK